MTARELPLPEISAQPDSIGTARPIIPEQKDISRFQSIVSAPIKGMAKFFGADIPRLLLLSFFYFLDHVRDHFFRWMNIRFAHSFNHTHINAPHVNSFCKFSLF